MGPWPGLPTWPGTWPLLLTAAAIGVSVWKPYLSLGLSAALLLGQLAKIIPSMEANHWAIYLGTFIALGFIQWTAPRTERIVAGVTNAVFIAAMTVLLLSWRYGDGVGTFYLPGGDGRMLEAFGWLVALILGVMAGGCAAVGLLMSHKSERRRLLAEREAAEASIRESEIELIVEQERTRIARDLHDVLAHSLAVITAQADGARYIGEDQPQPVVSALENIARSARNALVDAQRVIEGVDADGEAAPQPTIGDVSHLLIRMQQGSLQISRTESGIPVELTPGQEVAVFRIIQECLTNALRHGGRGTAAVVHLDWSGPGLTLHINSELSATTTGSPAGTDHSEDNIKGSPRVGRGIAGMRERAHLTGGWLTAGADGDHFRVTAFLPYGAPLVDAGARKSAAADLVVTGSALLERPANG